MSKNIDVDDIPLPSGSHDYNTINDDLPHPTAFKFAIAGLGQGGSRIAEQFYKIGYRRVAIINTTHQDTAHIQVPDPNKLIIPTDFGGAGKNPECAHRAAKQFREEIYDHLKKNWGNNYDYALVCTGAGGGTGAGSLDTVIDIIGQLNSGLGLVNTHTGVIVALPKQDEGHRVAANTIMTLDVLKKHTLTPVITVDNERIRQIYPNTPITQFWDTANKSTVTLLHLFNKIAAQSSPITTFDPADLASVLNSGNIALGATAIAQYSTQENITHAIRQQLQNNILVSNDISKASSAALIIIANQKVLGSISQENLDHAFQMLNRILSPDSTVHRGIYHGNNNDLRVYTIIGGLPESTSRHQQFMKQANLM